MQFKIDENLHDDVAALVSSHGHHCETVHNEGLRGSQDQELISACKTENRALITLDLDFADIRSYPPDEYPGIIVLRLSSQSRQNVLDVIAKAISLADVEPVAGRLWIVTEAAVRIRG